MLAGDKPLDIPVRPVDPYLHLDNRGLVVFDGRRAVLIAGPAMLFAAETIKVLLDEKRATRRQGDTVFGGFVGDDGRTATIFAGPPEDLATLQTDTEALALLAERLRSR